MRRLGKTQKALASLAVVGIVAIPGTTHAGPKSGGGKGKGPTRGAETTLYMQYGPLNGGVNSQNYESNLDANDNEAADDFKVPTGKQWEITKVTAQGFYRSETPAWVTHDTHAALAPNVTFNVSFYSDGGGVPGTVVATAGNVGSDDRGVLALPSPVALDSGTYWVSVQANVDYLPYGRWYWHDAGWGGTPAKWRQPGGSNPGCVDWCDANQGTIIGGNLAFTLTGFSR